jgi:cytochrome c peroxidase
MLWADNGAQKIEDSQLIKSAYQYGLRPVPMSYEVLLKTLKSDDKVLSKEKIALGKKLFFEKDLSLSKDISCASCHSLEQGGVDSLPTAIGHKNRKNPFHLNSPTVLNTAFSQKLFWDGRSPSLANQAKGPMQASFEMAITPQLAKERIEAKKDYRELFEKVYGKRDISFEKIADAIAAYEKTLVTKGRYDDYLLGDFNALKLQEKEGLELFINKGCVGCHNGIGLGGQVTRKFPLTYHPIWTKLKPQEVQALQKEYHAFLKSVKNVTFSNDQQRLTFMHLKLSTKNTELIENGFFDQVYDNDRLNVMTSTACTHCHENNSQKIKKNLQINVAFPFENRGKFLGKEQEKQFRVPLLRNVVKTKPYFHNGSVEKLEDAIKIMGVHQSRVELTQDEIDKIVAFLKAVDGKLIEYIK